MEFVFSLEHIFIWLHQCSGILEGLIGGLCPVCNMIPMKINVQEQSHSSYSMIDVQHLMYFLKVKCSEQPLIFTLTTARIYIM